MRSVAATTDAELANEGVGNNITIAGYAARDDEDMNVEHPRVSPGYFSGMGVPLIAGREFTEADRVGTQKVAIVNETLARRFFGSPDRALGHYFTQGAGDVKPDIEIVGVVRDAKHENVRSLIKPTTFTPYLQEKDPGAMSYYIRTVQSPDAAESTIRQAMQTLELEAGSRQLPNDDRAGRGHVDHRARDRISCRKLRRPGGIDGGHWTLWRAGVFHSAEDI